ncbi:PREDICTED: inactive polypeptide N-acetylgalactosaminyltransferase-like protein 5 isoform X2 [Chinchilla lanigera]|uniref:inactive polypeptide N-acetylgalactosaminyltransferase-like protein 5 isoform X2 n=1 Tax=Chinchilla lanigera TaxID=34839 RepID=UPI00038EEA4C|nr:PREDICTED: inactive polypeptide N-acetylgalactosaminyltransferase-like protein 5 isoform X2 [Chinchilla lanigera]
MRCNIIQYLFYGSLIFGIWTALFFVYFHREYMRNPHKKIQEPALTWSQVVQAPEEIAKPFLVMDSAEEEVLTEWKPFSPLNQEVNYSDPEFLDGFVNYGFNAMLSRSLGPEREVPDTRDKRCHYKHYSHRLPTASIIICFYNEEFNALLRTVFSVVYLTPPHLLEEIVLVDDMSTFDDLKEKLNYFLERFRGKVKLVRNKKREGLIRAKMIGASHASGEVLVFLDSHCEVNRVWLEPLLDAIARDSRTVVTPLIDVIDDLSLAYSPSPLVRGAFDWNLQFRSPAMAGGIFAIHRPYFYELGQYDKDMDIWGAENLELSLRIWMCGGQLFVIPCSRVGHITKRHLQTDIPLRNAMVRNYLRVVHVWLDEYKEQFFLRSPGLKSMTYGNISERVQLRKQLGCKSFQWYMETVFPELEASMNS